MLAITISATKNYLHAWMPCIRALTSAAAHHPEAHVIFSTDESEEAKKAAEFARHELPEGWKLSVIKLPLKDSEKDYKVPSQLRIAALQGAGFSFARKIRATSCLCLESDVILTGDALRVMEWTLSMPNADGSPYYDIAAATYPNGMFLGGFGSPTHPIAEDFLEEERVVPARLTKCLAACRERLKSAKSHEEAKKEMGRMQRLSDRLKKCPPKGNVFELNSKGYRRRGWMDNAYPGIGRGSIVPSDWCGLGATLLSAKALALADFTGYDGRGTQDLFLCWKRWYPAGLRIACVPHVACDHIKHGKDGKLVHYRAYHETEGEFKGHLRQMAQEFVSI